MPVVINELEVVVAPPESGKSASSAPAAPVSPPEVAELLERRARQELRVFAH